MSSCFLKLINVVYFWLGWVLVAAHRLAAHGCGEWRLLFIAVLGLLLWQSTDSRRVGSVVAAHGPSCPMACGIFPDQGSNPSPCSGRQILNCWTTRDAPVFLKRARF